MRKEYVKVEDCLNIFDESRYWLYIPGFNGYEISNDGYVRSMKHYRRYPYGILISPVKRKPYGQSCDPLFEISDDNNKRQRIRLSQLMHLAASNQFAVAGYPRPTILTSSSGRNKFVKNDQGAYVKVYNGPGVRKSLNIPPMDNNAYYAKFTIIQDGTELPNMEYKGSDIRVPLISLKGDEYYGRKDCRTICDLDVYSGPSEIFYRGEPT